MIGFSGLLRQSPTLRGCAGARRKSSLGRGGGAAATTQRWDAARQSTRKQQLGHEASAGHVGLAGEEEQLGEEAARNFDI